jgi:hypothetical protein
VLLVAVGVTVYHLARGTTFWFDEWTFVLNRRGTGLGPFLRPYNGHFSLIPVAIYRLLFATVGLTDYTAYRVILIALLLLCGVLVFVYAKPRVGNFLALCAAALLLLLGPGWQDMIWPFQMAWLISLAAGVGALLLLDRRTRAADLAASALVLVALASSAVGDVFAVGVAVDLLWGRRRWRDGWIVAAPLVLYGLWWAAYQQPQRTSSITQIPAFVANAAAAAVASLAGRGHYGFLGPGPTMLTWGRVLLGIAVGLLVWRLIRLRRVPARVLALLVMLLAFWFATALTRAWLLGGNQAWSSRYIFVGGFLIVLLAVELAVGLTIPWLVKVLIGACVVLAVIPNVGSLRSAAAGLRTTGQTTRADLGALQIGRPNVTRAYVARGIPGFPIVVLRAGPYFAAIKALGSPAASPAQIATGPENARQVADAELIGMDRATLEPSSGALPVGPRPSVVVAEGGKLADRGSCVTFSPAGGVTGRSEMVVELPRSSPGLLLTARGGPATVAARRFASAFTPVGALQASRSARLQIAPDLAVQPWYVRVAPTAGATACGLR